MPVNVSRRQFTLGALACTTTLAGVSSPFAAMAKMKATAISPDKWDALGQAVGGRLVKPTNPWTAAAGKPLPDNLKNPFYLQTLPGATQTTGWIDAWDSTPSPYAVAAENTNDIAEAVKFARANDLPIAVKGAGHDYLGRNSTSDGLLVWTHNLRGVTVHDSFVPKGAPSGEKGVHAVSALAGTRWVEVFKAATDAGRYVQGGGCVSVGACGGFTLGSGFGPFSKRYGSGAASVLEFEVVTADGQIIIANDHMNSDLFWALRGGGGGTYGIVSRVTYMSHEMPKTVGIVTGSVTAKSDAAYHRLIADFFNLYVTSLDNEAWGESVVFAPDNTISFRLTFLDKSIEEGEEILEQFFAPLRTAPSLYDVAPSIQIVPFLDLWDADYWLANNKDFVIMDPRADAPDDQFWWSGNQNEVSWFINGYESRWVPTNQLRGDAAKDMTDAFFEASRHQKFIFQINKGLSGEPEEIAARERNTALHPAALDAAGLVLMVSAQQYKHVGIASHEPDMAKGKSDLAKLKTAMGIIEAATPNSGAYANEADFYQKDWKQAFWGSHYPRLLEIKRKYDPDHVFTVHHGVGSDEAM
jgi:FAD/FMN-containing dehydrogenase